MLPQRCGCAIRRGFGTIRRRWPTTQCRLTTLCPLTIQCLEDAAMAKTRRVVRKVEPSAAYYVEEQLWPVLIGLVVLGGFLMGVSLAYLPLSGVAWYRTAWPSVVGIPVVIAAAMAAMAYVDNRLFRRSLQLSLVLC